MCPNPCILGAEQSSFLPLLILILLFLFLYLLFFLLLAPLTPGLTPLWVSLGVAEPLNPLHNTHTFRKQSTEHHPEQRRAWGHLPPPDPLQPHCTWGRPVFSPLYFPNKPWPWPWPGPAQLSG